MVLKVQRELKYKAVMVCLIIFCEIYLESHFGKSG